MEEKRKKETSLGEKLAYSLGDSGSGFVWTFTGSFLTLYYTDSVLMSAAFIGTIMLVTRICDGISDIVMGFVIERTHTKMGKARPWFGYFTTCYFIFIDVSCTARAFRTEKVYLCGGYLFYNDGIDLHD